jgi:hypothetical protein
MCVRAHSILKIYSFYVHICCKVYLAVDDGFKPVIFAMVQFSRMPLQCISVVYHMGFSHVPGICSMFCHLEYLS